MPALQDQLPTLGLDAPTFDIVALLNLPAAHPDAVAGGKTCAFDPNLAARHFVALPALFTFCRQCHKHDPLPDCHGPSVDTRPHLGP